MDKMDLSKLKPIKHIKIKKTMKANELVKAMKEIGFNARYLGLAADVLETAIKDKDCMLFLGFAVSAVSIDCSCRRTDNVICQSGRCAAERRPGRRGDHFRHCRG